MSRGMKIPPPVDRAVLLRRGSAQRIPSGRSARDRVNRLLRELVEVLLFGRIDRGVGWSPCARRSGHQSVRPTDPRCNFSARRDLHVSRHRPANGCPSPACANEVPQRGSEAARPAVDRARVLFGGVRRLMDRCDQLSDCEPSLNAPLSNRHQAPCRRWQTNHRGAGWHWLCQWDRARKSRRSESSKGDVQSLRRWRRSQVRAGFHRSKPCDPADTAWCRSKRGQIIELGTILPKRTLQRAGRHRH